MIDYNQELVSQLKTILPTYFELRLTNNCKIPCISYQERNNYDTETGDTLKYSVIIYTIKVWARTEEEVQRYTKEIDKKLYPLGFKRTSTGELTDGTLIQKITTYQCQAKENV